MSTKVTWSSYEERWEILTKLFRRLLAEGRYIDTCAIHTTDTKTGAGYYLLD